MPIPLGILAVAGAGAGGAASSFDLLETTVLGSDAASVTFSSLGSYSDYKHLQIRATIKNTDISIASLFMELNSDTANNYSWHYLFGDGSSVTSAAVTNTNKMICGATGEGDVANIFGATVIDILDFGNTNKNTTIRALTGCTPGNRLFLASGAWRNTAAVTTIKLTDTSANLKTGSRFSLYGVK